MSSRPVLQTRGEPGEIVAVEESPIDWIAGGTVE